MARISGAALWVSSPLSAWRHAESAGQAVSAMTARPATIVSRPAQRPFFSSGDSRSSVGASFMSPSMAAVRIRRGSTTLSVRNQPIEMISTEDAAMKKALLSGLTVCAGSSSCAPACVKPASSGSRLVGTKLAE